MRAIISVYDKSGIVEFAKFLKEKGVEIISTGSTYTLLKENGINAKSVENYTGFEEILDGRVKTLQYKIHAGILADLSKPKHQEELLAHNIEPIDIVVVNLYPFEQVALRSNNEEELIENIDIGGPTLIRAASKNYKRVLVVVDPKDYSKVMENFDNIDLEFRKKCALKAFALTSYYDSVIVEKFGYRGDVLNVGLKLKKFLRYGENPHQTANFFRLPLKKGLPNMVQLQGKEISFNNILDIDIAYRMMIESNFLNKTCMCAIIKHNTPCGAACADSAQEAYEKALFGDPVSAFGGIVGINDTVDGNLAKKISERFYEVVVAFDFKQEALSILSKKKNLILVKVDKIDLNSYKNNKDIKSVIGGFVVQDIDYMSEFSYETVTKAQSTDKQIEDLKFAWFVAKFAKSNAICFALNSQTLAIGAGQTSRVDAIKCAAQKAKDLGIGLAGSVLASDGFFPFRDNIDVAKSYGAVAFIQPGGSIRDEEVIKACNEYNLPMVFTKKRHFRH
ncbi:IMP cyclohydrolase / Phosphoribosylaminoimidazolecarboxamide formyltransferase [Desulfurella amilsii]|uniref:Bifunctional purine biosynthesis protein PurH n=1 Tax=Desulfurella amilsii TaxID=1562698 RepID=A0A1X4Y034_9BACT|nr:bifunctional phosphoribosylaminoimidazolecarboxamide formyltransferase/IMP cyclohydrolase [Desulfurella amilsii]OSS43113.1 IMP cyclohydrolase / Phosphoribosylaminoimidazolecarboxamide formyltransferase [Desulfurella amilsii]